jgi:hypothetical protein
VRTASLGRFRRLNCLCRVIKSLYDYPQILAQRVGAICPVLNGVFALWAAAIRTGGFGTRIHRDSNAPKKGAKLAFVLRSYVPTSTLSITARPRPH